MNRFDEPTLRRILLLDAATCATTGTLLTMGANFLQAPLGLFPELMRYAGLLLFPSAAFMLWTARRRPLTRWAVLLIIAGNGLWVLESLLLLASPSLAPTTSLGTAFVLVQSVAVAALAALEWWGLKAARSPSAITAG
ncbi:MAG: hypothetical protein ACRCYS_17280 [Beijerinckiaceae bacterium]